jgi:HSP20 family protein
MKRNPDDPFDDIFREIERMMEDMMGVSRGAEVAGESGASIHVDIHEYDDTLTVIADVPGLSKKDIDLQCDGRFLSIQASTETREYNERIQLPATVDEHSASATYNNGVLEVSFDRADESAEIDLE